MGALTAMAAPVLKPEAVALVDDADPVPVVVASPVDVAVETAVLATLEAEARDDDLRLQTR